jgi:hypothetical protein
MKNRFVLFLTLIPIIALALLFVLPLVTVLEISDAAGRTLAEVPVREGDLVSVNYTHSVEKTPVNETYMVDKDGCLKLAFATFESGGAGLPSDASYDIRQGSDGTFVITNFNRTYDTVTYGTGNISRHRVIIGQDEYRLYDILKGNNKFTMRITRDSPVNIFILHI